jgi:hypothetical protein
MQKRPSLKAKNRKISVLRRKKFGKIDSWSEILKIAQNIYLRSTNNGGTPLLNALRMYCSTNSRNFSPGEEKY